ncbi:hypothetical protein [Bradyrhizobium sp. 1]|uniref:hypothetical protein n=1 Tax=Bradyrhizobium sp. 1 TaxID=241591 RepID=UPI001FF90ED4|nr:hypothetical protein [Bradyrhizobium sp. 1]MCK1391695.1 hypothetical protein [Bradyrhizobium sp. 1]
MTEFSSLPARAMAKLAVLQDAEQQALTLSSSTTRKISELHHALGLNPNGTNADVMRLEIERQEGLQRKHQDRHRQCIDLYARVQRYLAMLPADVTLLGAKPIKTKLKDGESHLSAVERIRREIAGLASERLSVEQAGLTSAEMRAQAKKWITERALQGRPTITATHDKFEINFVDPAAYSMHLDIPSMLAWFDPEGMETKLNELIDSMPKPKLALAPIEKADKLRELKRSILTLERQEEALIVEAEEVGTIIPRRTGADPRAILGIVVDRSRKANAA